MLIAVVILAIGILALAGFQMSSLRSGSDAKTRTVATALAQDQLENMRNFAARAGYTNIVDNAIGSTTMVSDVEYTITWDASDYYISGTGIAASPTGTGTSEFKKIEVQVAWTDQSDDTQSVTLDTLINNSLPVDGGRTATSPTNRDDPVVGYVPGAAPDIVSISLDTSPNIIKEATKPEPDTISQSGTTLVSFDEVTYNDATDTLRRDASLTLNCVCVQGRSDTQKGLAPTIFDFEEGIFEVGEEVASKRVGHMATGNERIGGVNLNLSKQPDICDICCRDHHDIDTVSDKYDPFRPTSDFITSGPSTQRGDHNHYFPDSSGVLQLANNDSSGDLYLENCRFVRVNGIWRLTQDWRQESLQTISSTFLQTSVGLSAFQDYVKQFLKEYVQNIALTGGATYPQVTPNSSSFSSAYTAKLAALENLEDGSVDDINLTTTSPNDQTDLVSRAIFIDHMDDELINKVSCMIDGTPKGSGATCTDIPINAGFLAFVPFHEINVTRLANWSVSDGTILDSNGDNFNEPLESGSERGRVTALSGSPSGSPSVVTAVMELSNSGLTDTREIDPDDATNTDDKLNVVVTSGSGVPTTGPYTVSGTIAIAGGISTNPSDVTVVGSSSGSGSFPCTKPTQSTYTCTLDATGTNTLTVSGYNYNVTRSCRGTSTTVVFDNEANGAASVVDDALLTDASSFVFDGTAITTDQIFDITISRDGGQGACP